MNLQNKTNNYNSGFNNNTIKNYEKYSYIVDFIDTTSKKNKENNKRNLNCSETKGNKTNDIKENINKNDLISKIINNKEIVENNNNILNVNKNEIKINYDIDNNKNEINKSFEHGNNINLKIDEIQINENNNIINGNKEDLNNNNNVININEKILKKQSKIVLNKDKRQDIPKINLKQYKNYSSLDIKKNNGKNKLKLLNSSSDDIYNNNKNYLNIKINNRVSSEPLYKFRQLSAQRNSNRINELSNKLNTILNLSTYNILIKKSQIKKAGLLTSISNLENSIKAKRKRKENV